MMGVNREKKVLKSIVLPDIEKAAGLEIGK